MLRDQLKFGASLQATKKDPKTGAEVGKYHHESPGVEIRGLSTLYNGYDPQLWTVEAKVYFNSIELPGGDLAEKPVLTAA